jgi:hypothetical protein
VFVDKEMDTLEELVARNHPIFAFGMDQGGIVADTKP